MKVFDDLRQRYEFLVPDKLEGGLLLVMLNRKIEAQEIDEEFTRLDVQLTLEEIARLENSPSPQTERILKRLLQFFLLRPHDRPDRYYLSEYAKNFVSLLEQALDSPYRDFPLKKNFERHFRIRAAEISDITDFESWYQQSFIAASKKVISEHLGSLQDELDKSIQQLNTILRSDELSALEMAREFATIFQRLGEKREQISDALFYKDTVVRELKNVVDSFYHKIDVARHYQTEEERQVFQQLEAEWKRAEQIHREVNNFFRTVDKRLERISAQVNFSSTKLSELQENFKAQSHFKINLRKLLELVLTESRFGRDSLVLPADFPKKKLPAEEIKFFGVPYHNFQLVIGNKALEAPTDDVYENEQHTQFDKELERQEHIDRWVEKLSIELEQEGALDWSEKFFEIAESEQDSQVAIQVGFELIEQAQRNSNHEIEVSENIQGRDQIEFNLWATNIKVN